MDKFNFIDEPFEFFVYFRCEKHSPYLKGISLVPVCCSSSGQIVSHYFLRSFLKKFFFCANTNFQKKNCWFGWCVAGIILSGNSGTFFNLFRCQLVETCPKISNDTWNRSKNPDLSKMRCLGCRVETRRREGSGLNDLFPWSSWEMWAQWRSDGSWRPHKEAAGILGR